MEDRPSLGRFPLRAPAIALVGVCVAPALLMWAGVDFGTRSPALTPVLASGMDAHGLGEAARLALRGSYTHTILEWTAFVAAAVACVLAFFQFRRFDDPELPIIGLALICSGAIDAFHTLAADRLIQTAADDHLLIPFTWALSRLFNGAILLCGLALALAATGAKRRPREQRSIIAAGGLFVLGAYAVVRYSAAASSLPAVMFPDALIKRPYDLYAVAPFLGVAALLLRLYLPRRSSPFAAALLLSLIPAVATQLYMAFGSDALYDSAFNVAHGLKAVSYVVPVFGILFEYERTHAALELQSADVERLSGELDHRVTHDQLTGLPNRSLFVEHATRSIAQARRSGAKVAVLFIDLDGFKEVNDTLGHEAGDELLVSMSARLRENVRASDVCSRLGSDEFTLLMLGVERSEHAGVVAAKLVDCLSTSYSHRGHKVIVTASVGVSIFPNDGGDTEELIRAADRAMHTAKERGGRRFEYFDAAMDRSAHAAVALRGDLLNGMRQGEFVLYYQPQVRIDRPALAGVEALVRWEHPERGLLPPGAFLEVAEQSGLIIDLGQWVLEEALAQQRRWRESLGDMKVAVNVSLRQVRAPEFSSRVLAAIEAFGSDPGLVELELTESWMIGDIESALAHLEPLKDIGIRLSIDDFGTGYSTLRSLTELPIDALKIDRSFVQDIERHRGHQAIASATITMARALGLEVIAEGVEREAELAMLREYGLKEAQGYLFSKPIPPDEFEVWAADWELAKH